MIFPGWNRNIKFVVAVLLFLGVFLLNSGWLSADNIFHVGLSAAILTYSITILLLMRGFWGVANNEEFDKNIQKISNSNSISISVRKLIWLAGWVLFFRTSMILLALAYFIQATNAVGYPILSGEKIQPYFDILFMVIGYLIPPFTWATNEVYSSLQVALLNLKSWYGVGVRVLIYSTIGLLLASVVADWWRLLRTGELSQLEKIINTTLDKID